MFRDSSYLNGVRMVIRIVHCNAVTLFNTEKNRRFLSKNHPLLRQRQRLVPFSGSQRNKGIQLIRILRHKQIDIVAFSAGSLYLHGLLMNIYRLIDRIIVKQARFYILSLPVGKFLLQTVVKS